jgi:hypothetical protein
MMSGQATAKRLYRKIWDQFCNTYDERERHEYLARLAQLSGTIAPAGSPEWKAFINTLEGYVDFIRSFDDICEANRREAAYKGE